MIKVNLLLGQSTNTASPEAAVVNLDGLSSAEIQRQGIVRIFILLILPIVFFIYESQSIPKKKAQIANVTSEINELQAYNEKTNSAVGEIKKFQEDEKKIKKQIEIVEKLSRSRMNEIYVLDLIQQVIPERVWLSNLEFSDSKVRIKGQAAVDADITIFIEALSRSVFLNDVQPGGTSEGFFEGVKIREFEISASLERAQ